MKVKIYYNQFKGVFVAKRDDGTVVKVDPDFGVVDNAAYKITTCVEYDLNSFPEAVRNKILGPPEDEKNRESYKSTFMRLIFSYEDVVPPDNITRSLARKIVRKGLEIEQVITSGGRVYIIAKRDTEVFVYEIRKDSELCWRYCVIKDKRQLPKKVSEYLGGIGDEMWEAKVQSMQDGTRQ